MSVSHSAWKQGLSSKFSVSASVFQVTNPCSSKTLEESCLILAGSKAFTVKVDAKLEDKTAGKATAEADSFFSFLILLHQIQD